MFIRSGAIVLAMALVPAVMLADGQGRSAQRARRVVAITPTCASDLGVGAKTKRRFCDVIIASTPPESVSVALPPHNGSATLMFDLHNRFDVPASQEPAQAFASHTAIAAVIRLTGDVIDRAGVSREYRNPADLFDRLAGSARGAPLRAVAPGYAQAVRIVIPPSVNVVGIVGTRLELWRVTGRGAFDTPNKPIAMVSNLRVEYTKMTDAIQSYDVLIIGAGPAGLAAAIAAKQHGLSYVVLERATLVNSLLHYPDDMVFFTTPELMEIGGLPFVSPNEKPSRREALRYYRRVTDAFSLDIRLHELVTGLKRASDGLFRVTSEPAQGGAVVRTARFVVLAAGAYDVPNVLGVPGEDLPHVSHYYRNPHFHYRRRVVIVGGKNSAAEAALDLYRSGSHVLLVHRGAALGDSIKYWVKPDIENRIKEGSVHARFNTRVVEITPSHVRLEGPDGQVDEPADAVLLLTGYKSDPVLLRDAGATIVGDTGAPVHNAETFETTVPGLFVIGAFVAGKQSGQIFIENGRFHGQVVIAEITQRRGQKRS